MKLHRAITPLQHIEKAVRRSIFTTPCLVSNYYSTSRKAAPLQERRMRDVFRLYARAGDGGNGCSSFRRSRHQPHGIADGGNGGRGGDVILECSPTIWDFSGLQHHVNAKRGGHGSSKNKIGTRGSDKVVLVPVGTVIHLVDGELPPVVEKSITSVSLDPWDIPGTLDDADQPEESNEESKSSKYGIVEAIINTNTTPALSTLSSRQIHTSNEEFDREMVGMEAEIYNGVFEAEGEDEGDEEDKENEGDGDDEEVKENIQYNVAELTKQGQQIVVSRGGEGGLGNILFPKAHRNSIEKPSTEDQKLSEEEESALSTGLTGSQSVLILELKSIADVGLVGMPNAGKSTILGAISRAQPTIGHYAFTTMRPNLGRVSSEDFSMTVADIPGLIKGAHENRGLGHAFLRHIERTRVLAYVVDLTAGSNGRKGIPPWEQLGDLVLELEYHLEGLSSRPSIIVANKIDEEGTDKVYDELKRRVHGVPIYPVCAVLHEGIAELKDGLRALVDGGESCGLRLDNIMVD